MIAEVQVIPSPPGTPGDRYAHIDRAIAVIKNSGLPYEVGAAGTTIEGDRDELWTLLRRVHEACVVDGVEGVVTIIKVIESGPNSPSPTMDTLRAKHRG